MEFKEKPRKLRTDSGRTGIDAETSPEMDKVSILESLLGVCESLNDSKDTIKAGRLARQ